MRTNELILYKNMEYEELLLDMTFLMEHYDNEYYNQEDLKGLLFSCMNELLELSECHGFFGNLWHTFLTFLLANDENAYSTSCEITGETKGSLNLAAEHDFWIFKELFDYDFTALMRVLDAGSFSLYKRFGIINQLLLFCLISYEIIQMHMSNVRDWNDFRCSVFGMFHAKRFVQSQLSDSKLPIKLRHALLKRLYVLCLLQLPAQITDSVTYSFIKNNPVILCIFIVQKKGKTANNCLLYGDAGTGKSSSIKAILNQYYDQGLRMIEVYKHQFQDLNEVIAQIKNRNYKFIIYMDDLSFEEFEIEYKYLKAVIEGGLEKKPDNILIYATSNRRHLVRETFRDKQDRDEELHTNDTVQEKLSLVARFGVKIYFASPAKKAFQKIVTELAKRNHISMPEEELLLEVNKWELSHGGMSGRTAQQFIDYLLGKE